MQREAVIAALGSSVISAALAAGLGLIYGLDAVILITMMLLSAIGGAWFGYRSRLHS